MMNDKLIDECWICGKDIFEDDMYVEVIRKMRGRDDSIVGRYCTECGKKNVAGVCEENLEVD